MAVENDRYGENQEQAEYWQSEATSSWVKLADDLAQMHQDVTRKLINRAGLMHGERVVDIGCGTGQSTRAAARAVGPDGKVKAIDISPPMLAAARDRHPRDDAAPPDYELGDAQSFHFTTGGYDRVISQFGVMFFSKPGKAFMNIRRAVRPGATMTFAAWAAERRNPWFYEARKAASAVMGEVEADREGPGPMAFADIQRVTWILAANGWRNVRGKAVEVTLTPSGSLEDVSVLATRLGPAASILRHHGGGRTEQKEIALKLTELLAPYAKSDGVRIPGFVNIITADA